MRLCLASAPWCNQSPGYRDRCCCVWIECAYNPIFGTTAHLTGPTDTLYGLTAQCHPDRDIICSFQIEMADSQHDGGGLPKILPLSTTSSLNSNSCLAMSGALSPMISTAL